jgi:hypothetical protein
MGSSGSNVPLVDMRQPVPPNVGATVAALRADHLGTECADHNVVGQVIHVHGRAVAPIDRAAVDQQVAATVRADMAERHRLEFLDLALDRFASTSSSPLEFVNAPTQPHPPVGYPFFALAKPYALGQAPSIAAICVRQLLVACLACRALPVVRASPSQYRLP